MGEWDDAGECPPEELWGVNDGAWAYCSDGERGIVAFPDRDSAEAAGEEWLGAPRLVGVHPRWRQEARDEKRAAERWAGLAILAGAIGLVGWAGLALTWLPALLRWALDSYGG